MMIDITGAKHLYYILMSKDGEKISRTRYYTTLEEIRDEYMVLVGMLFQERKEDYEFDELEFVLMVRSLSPNSDIIYKGDMEKEFLNMNDGDPAIKLQNKAMVKLFDNCMLVICSGMESTGKISQEEMLNVYLCFNAIKKLINRNILINSIKSDKVIKFVAEKCVQHVESLRIDDVDKEYMMDNIIICAFNLLSMTSDKEEYECAHNLFRFLSNHHDGEIPKNYRELLNL